MYAGIVVVMDKKWRLSLPIQQEDILSVGGCFDVPAHRREFPAITYMAMGFRPRSFPVGEMYVKGIGRLTKVKKNYSLRFSIAS